MKVHSYYFKWEKLQHAIYQNKFRLLNNSQSQIGEVIASLLTPIETLVLIETDSVLRHSLDYSYTLAGQKMFRFIADLKYVFLNVNLTSSC